MKTPIRAAPAIPRCAIYARCSAEKQAEKDLSIPAQIDAARLAARQRGWEVVGEFIDAAESASSDARPQFQEMISVARKRPAPFEYIVVWKFSRFSRNREDSVLYKRLLERHGVRVISLNEPVDDSPAGRMLEGILEVVDEFYSRNLAQDTARGLRRNASLGFRNGGPAPIGYLKRRTGDELSPKIKLEPDPVWGPIVRRMFRLALEGEGACTLAARLHAEGERSPRGRPWSKQTVLNVLRNPVYTGTLVWGVTRTGFQAHLPIDPVRVGDAWPALISPEDFALVQQRIEERSRDRIHPNILRSSYLLSGLLFCGHCGQPFIGHPARGGKYHYYGCQRKMKTGAAACAARLLPQAQVEEAICGELQRAVLTPAWLTELIREVNAELAEADTARQAELQAVQGQQAEAQRRLERLYCALEEGTMELALLAPRIREWKSRMDALRGQEAALLEAGGAKAYSVDAGIVRSHVERLHLLLQGGSMSQRRSFLRSWVRRIEVRGYDLMINYITPPLPGEPVPGAGEGAKMQEAEPGVNGVLPRGKVSSHSVT